MVGALTVIIVLSTTHPQLNIYDMSTALKSGKCPGACVAHKKDVIKMLTNCQKWIISQTCEITKKFHSLKNETHILCSPGTVA